MSNCKKIRIQATITEKMAYYIAEKKPDHMTRSIYLEEVFWAGIESLRSQNRALD